MPPANGNISAASRIPASAQHEASFATVVHASWPSAMLPRVVKTLAPPNLIARSDPRVPQPPAPCGGRRCLRRHLDGGSTEADRRPRDSGGRGAAAKLD